MPREDLPGPLRSEAAAFRVLIGCVLALALIVAIFEIVRALS